MEGRTYAVATRFLWSGATRRLRDVVMARSEDDDDLPGVVSMDPS